MINDGNKEKYQPGDYKLIQYQILRRITNEILGIKGLNTVKGLSCYTTGVNQSRLIQAFQ